MSTARLPLAEGDPGWWGWAEKDLWRSFENEHPEWASGVKTLVHEIHFDRGTCTDEILTSGVQFEGICLRVSELLGLVKVDRS